jgi:hypothetical protein
MTFRAGANYGAKAIPTPACEPRAVLGVAGALVIHHPGNGESATLYLGYEP